MAEGTIDVVKQVYQLKEDGLNHTQIAKKTGCSLVQVRRWLADPDKYSPYIDDVAVERALGGDRKVFEALTDFERGAFWAGFDKKCRATSLDLIKQEGSNGGHWSNPYLNQIADDFGLTPRRVSDLNQLAIKQRKAQLRTDPIRRNRLDIDAEEVRQIRKASAAGTPQRALALLHGISRSAICRIVTRKTWAHVE